MSLLSYIFPQTRLINSSKYNQLIRVNEESGRHKLLVNGSRQSGKYVRWLWTGALKNFAITADLPVRSILVMGVAGGDVIHELHRLYPGAQITGVDIDEIMIDIGRKYFGLDDIAELTLKKSDAWDFVNAAVKKKLKYDLIIVDIFIGRSVAGIVEQKDFLIKIKTLLNPSGKVIINYLRELEYKEKSELLSKMLKTVFGHVSDAQIARNRFFLASGK